MMMDHAKAMARPSLLSDAVAGTAPADPFDETAPPSVRAPAVPAGDRWAVVLAGGNGRRLERFVRQVLGAEGPKQFCRIIGTRSMLRHTWDRALRLVAPERIVTVITAGQERYLAEEGRRGVPGTVFVQPENKETAPGILLPLLWIARRSPGATVGVFPADHFIWEEERFADHMEAALGAAERFADRLTLLGVESDGPETGYGWIGPGTSPDPDAPGELYAVQRFWEKPDRRAAARLYAWGYLWNTFIMAGRAAAVIALADAALPHVMALLREAEGHVGTPAEQAALRDVYRRIPATNFSQALLARYPEASLVLAARGITWSDWGDPERVVRTLARFDRRPAWLPAYVRGRAQVAAGA